jgi:hypothetical protein
MIIIMKVAQKNPKVLFNEIKLADNPFSTYAYKYAMTESQPSQAKDQAIWGLIRMGLSMEAAKEYYQVVVPKMSRYCRKSEGGFADTMTDGYGTAPYLGQGDGVLFYIKQNNELVRGFDSSLRGSKSRNLIADVSPIPYTWTQQTIPLAAASNKFIAGGDTRLERSYGNPIA